MIKKYLFVIMYALLVTLMLNAQENSDASTKEIPLDKEPISKFKESEMIELDMGDSPDQIKIIPTQLLDFDEESQVIYGRDRTLIKYKDISLEADRIVYNIRLNEVQAEGNVVLIYKGEKMTSQAARYNLANNEGEAYGITGRQGVLYFTSEGILDKYKANYKDKPIPEEVISLNNPSLRQTNKDEVIVNNVSFTTDNFPIPMYRIKAKEAVILLNKRVFMRDAWFYIRELPVLYFPVYSKALKEPNPWYTCLGYSSKLGAYFRVGYEYKYYLNEPDFLKDDNYITRSQMRFGLSVDYFTKRGVGLSTKLKYNLLYGKHTGEMRTFIIQDGDRQVKDEETDLRWVVNSKHWSELTQDVYFQGEIDEVSDSEVYYDFLDRFGSTLRGRTPERSMTGAVTLNKDYYVARMMISIKDRISRNRLTDFSDPVDNDQDYDVRFDGKDWDEEGLPSNRYGTVSNRAPHFRFESNKINLLRTSPLYYDLSLDAFDNLDKGLNVNSPDDDSYVRGIDLYQRLTHLIRFTDKLTWMNQIGAGAAYFDRENKGWGYNYPDNKNDNGTPGDEDDDYYQIDDVKFSEQDEVLVGDRRRDIKDYNREYLYADFTSRLNMRFTESLRAYLKYIYREGTSDSLGEYYESIGSNYTREDLYNFRLKKHWVETGASYNLYYPNLFLRGGAGHNLQSTSDIYANEPINYIRGSLDYVSPKKTFVISPGAMYSTTQIKDPTAKDQYEQQTVQAGASLRYNPISKRWWLRSGFYWYNVLNDKLEERNDNDRYFNERDSKWTADLKVGAKVGPKYELEVGGRYDSKDGQIDKFQIGIARDLNDIILEILLGYRIDSVDDDKEYEIRFAVQPKIGEDKSDLFRQEFKVISIQNTDRTDEAGYDE